MADKYFARYCPENPAPGKWSLFTVAEGEEPVLVSTAESLEELLRVNDDLIGGIELTLIENPAP